MKKSMNCNDISKLCLTVIFQDNQGFHYSCQLAYHPCPVWMNGPNDYKVTMPDSVNYEFGSFEKLLGYMQESQHGYFIPGNKCIVVADNEWMNFVTEFEKVVQDIEATGFDTTIMLI